jgi:hypothetical protein
MVPKRMEKEKFLSLPQNPVVTLLGFLQEVQIFL